MTSLRILHIIDSLGRGGAETLLVSTIEAINLKHPDCKQYLVTLYEGGPLVSKLPDQVPYFNLGLSKYNFPAVIIKLNGLIKKLNVNVVHSHLLHSTLISRFALPAKTKLVSTYHSVFYDPALVDYARKELILDKITYQEKYYSIFVSQAVKENISAALKIKNNFSVLVNFASPTFTDSYWFNPEQKLKIVMVGNLNPVKNHELAIKALSKFQDGSVSLDIYGEGILRPKLEGLIKTENANVVLKGSAAMSSEILSNYDLFMMTSHHEGMPISLLEAMQTGLPSVLNDLPMLRETAGDSALYFDYDSEVNLVKNIKSIIENKQLLENLSQNAIKRSIGFSAKSYIDSLISIYSDNRKIT